MLKTFIHPSTVLQIENLPFAFQAIPFLLKMGRIGACELINQLSPPWSATILLLLELRAKENGDKKAAAILKRARRLKIQGTQGIVQTFRDTRNIEQFAH